MNNQQDLLYSQIKKSLGLFNQLNELPDYLQNNLADELRNYQKEALQYLDMMQQSDLANIKGNHLLFNMATGSGKTMIMAALMLYMFKEFGYQNFIFFVNTDAIIQKTKLNLLDNASAKYLFKPQIKIDGETIAIKEVECFPHHRESNTLYLKLSTIQKIHDELNNPKENAISYDDLKEQKIVLLGDEAHHFNAESKAKNQNKNSQAYKQFTWEKTINTLLNLKADNRLFEFTATIDLKNKEINSKYKDKIIYQYDLKHFMKDGFSKNVMLLEADENDEDKMLNAVLLSQYRKLIAQKYHILNFKTVILFKSNRIDTSKKAQEYFIKLIENLTPKQIKDHLNEKALVITSNLSVWHKVTQFYNQKELELQTIVKNIQEDFNQLNLLNVNKKDLLEEDPKLLSTLENINNPIRVVFAVAKVNEGWDVLNLYDIVRISEQASNNKTSTDSEAQLIGRGARYYPFNYKENKSYTRRFDNLTHELTILEQLHYHTINEPSYIKSLHESLDSANIDSAVDGTGTVATAKLKKDFLKTEVYKKGVVFYNDVIEVKPASRTWQSYSLLKYFEVSYLNYNETSIDKIESKTQVDTKLAHFKLEKALLKKALARLPFYYFENLKIYFPNLKSMNEFISSQEYLNQIHIDIKLPQNQTIEQIKPKQKVKLIEEVLSKIAKNIRHNYSRYIGTQNFISKPIKEIAKDYERYIGNNESNQKIEVKSSTGKKWFIHDKAILNGLEHEFVDWLSEFLPKLTKHYGDEIYLIRNDENASNFKLTEFNGVRGFMPDFILIINDKNNPNTYLQILIEPKGADRTLHDAWKEQMLAQLNNLPNLKIEINPTELHHYRLIGLRFYTGKKDKTNNLAEFEKDFEQRLLNGEKLRDDLLSGI